MKSDTVDSTVTYSDDFHDRFLVIANAELHGLGSPINCLGCRIASYPTPRETGRKYGTILEF